jgi:hypothetical protein
MSRSESFRPSQPIPACGECGCSGAEKPAVSGLLLLSICLSVVVPDLPAPSGLKSLREVAHIRISYTQSFDCAESQRLSVIFGGIRFLRQSGSSGAEADFAF